MQFENFDKKIKDLLSQRPPGNDDPRWDKMGPLLDKHMPREKKDHRRILVALFFFLLLGGGAFIIWQNNSGDKQNITSVGSSDKDQEQGTSKSNTTTGNTNTDAGTTIEKENVADQAPGANTTGREPAPEEGNAVNKKYSDPTDGPSPEFIITDAGVTKTKKNKPVVDQAKEGSNLIEKGIVNKEKGSDPLKTAERITGANDITKKVNEPAREQETLVVSAENRPVEKVSEIKNDPLTVSDKPGSKKKQKSSSFLNNLFFTLSAGPDFSMVGFDNTGKTKLTLGAGIGYQVSDKFSIRTGFYTARKVYAADPDDYNPPEAFWSWYPNLKNIDADCKIYEIPITIDYNFSRNKKQSWFVSTGVSSLIMKEETYDYYFKPTYSPNYVTYTKTYNNENSHLFSVLSLSGGYKRAINKNLSLQAEPYMKFAMSGVGFGKVKLNSGGILVSAVIKPFAKK
jgi:hypothetical protein